ncbi:MAG: glyoxalase [Betaproteobacteria bacterium]|nr:MAG: glyoxalase [Betaproteobacteria bacterium]
MGEFYKDVLGIAVADRPDLGFPGMWLQLDKTMVHLMEKEYPPELDPWFKRGEATSSVDHIAFKAHGFDQIKKRVIELGLDWRQTCLENAGLWQLFVLDPAGVIIELNFPINDEPPGSHGPDATRRYPPAE